MYRLRPYMWLFGLAVLMLVLAAGCGDNDEETPPVPSGDQPASAEIVVPTEGSVFPAGQAVQVSVIAQDDKSITRIELYVDNSLIESRVTPSESVLTTVSEAFTWSASIIGPHTLQARAYDSAGQMGASPIVAVEVRLGGEQPTPPSDGDLTPGPTNPPVGDTATPPAPADTATPESALVTANVNANVRGGPGTNYNVVGSLGEGESALVTGRNADSSWWQIGYAGGTAWIANSVVTANERASSAPVVSAPPPPPTNTPAPPTATVPPTATPGPSVTPQPTTGFRVDQTNLSAGQCTTVRWDFDSIKSIFLVFGLGYAEEGQPGHGTREVCPSITTTYKARVTNQDSSQQTHEATVNVTGGGCGDPYITQFAPTTYSVAAGKPFSVFWQADCAKSVRYIKGDGPEQAVSGKGSSIDETISAATTFQLKVEKNNGGFVFASFVVTLK